MNRTVNEAVGSAAMDRKNDDGDHDGFFFLDGLSKEELVDMRATALESEDRARKQILACGRRLEARQLKGRNL